MKKIKIQIKNRWTGSIIFEYESEKNTILNTLLKAIDNGANLYSADLYGANLYGADLRGANLYGADLYGANLYGADLYGANLYSADLRSANLYGADLYGANLYGADLYGANLYGADLRGANLEIKKIKHNYQIIPEEGSFIAWKKLSNGCLAKIEIPSKAARTCNILNRKCRARFVKTLKIWDAEGNEIKEMHGSHNNRTIYKVNRVTKADKWDNNFTNDCTHGIHFFVTKQEAINW